MLSFKLLLALIAGLECNSQARMVCFRNLAFPTFLILYFMNRPARSSRICKALTLCQAFDFFFIVAVASFHIRSTFIGFEGAMYAWYDDGRISLKSGFNVLFGWHHSMGCVLFCRSSSAHRILCTVKSNHFQYETQVGSGQPFAGDMNNIVLVSTDYAASVPALLFRPMGAKVKVNVERAGEAEYSKHFLLSTEGCKHVGGPILNWRLHLEVDAAAGSCRDLPLPVACFSSRVNVWICPVRNLLVVERG